MGGAVRGGGPTEKGRDRKRTCIHRGREGVNPNPARSEIEPQLVVSKSSSGKGTDGGRLRGRGGRGWKG